MKKCFWPWSHNYSKWKTTETGQVVRATRWSFEDNNAACGNYTIQERTCETCGKIELRTVETTL